MGTQLEFWYYWLQETQIMHLTTFVILSSLSISSCVAEFGAPLGMLPQPRTIAKGVTQGRPFEGRFRQTYIKKSLDGLDTIRTTTGLVVRDRQGRVRLEYREKRTATIYDPVRGQMHLLDLASKTARTTPLMDIAMVSGPGWIFAGLTPQADSQPEPAEVSGVLCQRRRFVVTDCPEGGTADVWISDDLRQLVREALVKENEELSWTLSEVHLIEPDQRQFEVPGDYQRIGGFIFQGN